MAGIITLGDKSIWIGNFWVYPRVLETMSEQVARSDPSLSAELITDHTYAALLLDLTHLDPIQFRIVVQAAERGYDAYAVKGAEGFRDAGDYSLFMRQFSELKCLLRYDPRSSETTQISGVIHRVDGVTWDAPSWIFDAVLEQVAAKVYALDTSTANLLLKARTCSHAGYLDLHRLQSSQHELLLRAAVQLKTSYATMGGRSYTDERLYAVMAPFINSFCDFINRS
jgi:hypothetical protein